MAKAKIVLYTSKLLKNGEHPIMIRISKGKKTQYISTGYSSKESCWDKAVGLPNKNHVHYKILKIILGAKCVEAERSILNLDEKNRGYGLTDVKKKIVKKAVDEGVFPFLDRLIKDMEKANKLGNATVYSDLKRSLEGFSTRKDLSFYDITVPFLNKYEQSFRERNMSDTGISFYMRTLRSTFNKAIVEGEADKDNYPFNDYKISKLKLDTVKRAISKEDINKIINLELEPNSRLVHSRNYFIFSYYNSGINFHDIAYLTWKNIVNGRLIYRRSKTGRVYNLLILQPALVILDFYKKISIGDDEHVFPILSNEIHKTESSKRNRIHKVLGQTNKDLKELSGLAELSTNLTTYVARHTYATVLKKSGISTSIISEALGHSSEKTTQIYLDSFENSILDEANKNIL